MNKAMTVSDNKGLSLVGQSWGTENVMSSDILIPSLYLMQGLSDLVSARKANQGDIVRSTTGEIVGGPDKPVRIIPITSFNTWILQEKVGQKYEYRAQEPMTAANQDLPWEYKQGGTDWKRTKSFNLYALIQKDIAAEREEMQKFKDSGELPDPSKALMPVMISFRSTSYKAGKTFATHFALAKKFGVPGAVNTFDLTCYQDKNDLGSYYVYTATKAGKTSPEDLDMAKEWYQTLAQNRHKVDDSELKGESAAPAETQF